MQKRGMTGYKSWWESSAILGALSGLIILGIGYLGFETDLSNTEIATASGVAIANILSIIGSFRRKEKIKSPLPL